LFVSILTDQLDYYPDTQTDKHSILKCYECSTLKDV